MTVRRAQASADIDRGAGVSAPRASIVICTWRRPQPLERCLRSLIESGYGPSDRVEVVTVHPPGNDASRTMVAERFPGVRIVDAPEANLSLQRNLGAREALGDILVYLDDDAWPTAGWLETLLAPLDDAGVAAVGGAILDPDGAPMLQCAAATSFGRTYPIADPSRLHAGHVLTLQGGNLAVRREALAAIGGFDENYRYHLDETDVCLRLTRAGNRLAYAGDAAVHHESAPGPHRRTLYDRDWYSVAKNQVYFAFRHVRRGRLRLAFVPWMLQLPKLARFLGWMLAGRMGPVAALSCTARNIRGTFAGYWKGLTKKPRLDR
ncbi:MAG: glycosyltransferase family 2 protein [Planctomycetota bacterium]